MRRIGGKILNDGSPVCSVRGQDGLGDVGTLEFGKRILKIKELDLQRIDPLFQTDSCAVLFKTKVKRAQRVEG